MEQTSSVFCYKCMEWYEAESAQWLSLNKNMIGDDLLTFWCPECKSVQTSTIECEKGY